MLFGKGLGFWNTIPTFSLSSTTSTDLSFISKPSISIEPDNLGIAYSRLDKPAQAENNFLKSLSINPDHPVANNEFALFKRKRGQFQEARVLFERAVESYPEYLPARKNLGILCDLYLNDASCALDHYRIYHKANPSDEEVKIWITSLEKKMDS